MLAKIKTLEENNTCTIIALPPNKKRVGYKWVYKINHHTGGNIGWYKACILAKGYTQTKRARLQQDFCSGCQVSSNS